MKLLFITILALALLPASALGAVRGFNGDGGSGGDARYTGTCRTSNQGQVVPVYTTGVVYKICAGDGFWYYVRFDGSSYRGED